MGGISVDIAESMNFVQSITQMFECDPEFECSPNDEHTLGEGGSGAKDEPNCAAIAEAADNKKMSAIEKKNRERFGDYHVDKLKAKNKDFQAMKRGKISKDDFIKKYPNSNTAQQG